MEIFDNVAAFVITTIRLMKATGISLEKMRIDHLGYQTATKIEFDSLKSALRDISDYLGETLVGECYVAVFKLKAPLKIEQYEISVIELFLRNGADIKNGKWEHIEFLSENDIETLEIKYPLLDWEKKAISREIFPMITLRLSDNIRIKFPRRGVVEEMTRILKK